MQFMRGLQDVWSVSGRAVLEAFDLSPFRLICDVGGERGRHARDWGPASPRGNTVGVPLRVGAEASRSRAPVGTSAPPRAQPALCGSDPGPGGGTHNLCSEGRRSRPCTGHAAADAAWLSGAGKLRGRASQVPAGARGTRSGAWPGGSPVRTGCRRGTQLRSRR